LGELVVRVIDTKKTKGCGILLEDDASEGVDLLAEKIKSVGTSARIGRPQRQTLLLLTNIPEMDDEDFDNKFNVITSSQFNIDFCKHFDFPLVSLCFQSDISEIE